MPPLHLILRSDQATGAADTASDFKVSLPHLPEFDRPFTLQVVSFSVEGTGTYTSVEIRCSLGSKRSYDTLTTGHSNCVGVVNRLGTAVGQYPALYCDGPGDLWTVRVQYLDATGTALTLTTYSKLILMISPVDMR